jgi:hypothetical protein
VGVVVFGMERLRFRRISGLAKNIGEPVRIERIAH